MREKFWGYFPLNENDFREIWNDSYIIVDTNILLNFYRYSKDTKDTLIDILEKKKGRLILHEIVLKEFFRNRYKVINEHCKIIDSLNEIFKEMKVSTIKEKIKSFRHTNLNKDNLISIIEVFESELKNEFEKCEIINFSDEDPILRQIINLFNNKMILEFNDDEKSEEVQIAENRFLNNFPPGYKDANKTGETKESNPIDEYRKYNDYFIWKQMINLSKQDKKNIIFVTDDIKEDWFRKNNGRVIGPREELLNEFYNETNNKIYIYNTEGFLRAINNNSKNLSDDMMNEITEVAEISNITNISNTTKYKFFCEDSLFKQNMNDFIKVNVEEHAKYLELNKLKFNIYKLDEEINLLRDLLESGIGNPALDIAEILLEIENKKKRKESLIVKADFIKNEFILEEE